MSYLAWHQTNYRNTSLANNNSKCRLRSREGSRRVKEAPEGKGKPPAGCVIKDFEDLSAGQVAQNIYLFG